MLAAPATAPGPAPAAATPAGLPPHITPTLPTSVRGPVPAEAGLEQARAGFDRLFDFDGIAAGDRFDIVKGSTAGPISVRGEGKMLEFGPSHAKVWGKGGRFGMSREATITIDQVSPTRATIQAAIKGRRAAAPVEVEIVDARHNYLELRPLDLRGRHATLQLDDRGRLVLDLESMLAPIDVHLVLEHARRGLDELASSAPAALTAG